jgi:hypothetical protein
VPTRISGAGIEAERAERAGARHDRFRLVDGDARRGERDLERQARGADGAARGVRLGERAAGPLLRVRRLGVAVEAHLDRADRQARQALQRRVVEPLAVGLDLELDAAAAERLGDVEEVRHDERLAAAEHRVGHLARDDVRRDAQRFARVELVAQRLARRRPGAAMHAREVAVARELPRDEQRRAERVDPVRRRAHRHAADRMPTMNSAVPAA